MSTSMITGAAWLLAACEQRLRKHDVLCECRYCEALLDAHIELYCLVMAFQDVAEGRDPNGPPVNDKEGKEL